MPTDYLIIGVGNTLRGDDGAGWALAERLQAALAAAGAAAQLRLVQQLLPELAAELAEIAPAVLIITDCAAEASSAALQELTAGVQAAAHSHGLTPAQLLALAVRTIRIRRRRLDGNRSRLPFRPWRGPEQMRAASVGRRAAADGSAVTGCSTAGLANNELMRIDQPPVCAVAKNRTS